MIEERFKKQLQQRLPAHSHIYKTLPLNEWIRAGSPHCWIEILRGKDVNLLEDKGYGYVAIFEDGKLTGCGHGLYAVVGDHYAAVYVKDHFKLFKEVTDVERKRL